MKNETSCSGCYWSPDCPFCGKRCDDYTGSDYGATSSYYGELKVRAKAYRAQEREYADGACGTAWDKNADIAARLASRYGR